MSAHTLMCESPARLLSFARLLSLAQSSQQKYVVVERENMMRELVSSDVLLEVEFWVPYAPGSWGCLLRRMPFSYLYISADIKPSATRYPKAPAPRTIQDRNNYLPSRHSFATVP
ncbi:hypothetical protein BDD12DRAFT_102318 [Trichophaea hybrida]|nr:hypothetical protein BDD12DRAFT_102318 [Trichophaea hybrida]